MTKKSIMGLCFLLLIFMPTLKAEKLPEAVWQEIWSQLNADQVFVRKDSVVLVKNDKNHVIYQAEMASLWSSEFLEELYEKKEQFEGLPGREFIGTAYLVEVDVSQWNYRIVKTGHVLLDGASTDWTRDSAGSWRTLRGNVMAEPLSSLMVEIYLQREKVNQRAPGEEEVVPLETMNITASDSWVEYESSSWGRYFFLPEEIKKLRNGRSDLGESKEIFDVLVRSDWSLKAQKETPEVENFIRVQEGRPAVRGLERTETDYMIWSVNLTDRTISYMAGAYLDSKGQIIFKEGSFLSFYWRRWDDPMLAGALAAYLLSHPDEPITEREMEPLVNIPPRWLGQSSSS